MPSFIDGGVALVTGASSGIGEAIARQLAPRVGGLVLVARRADRLGALADELMASHEGLGVCVVPCDLTDREATDSMIERALSEFGRIDVLVNNAGFGDMAMFDKTDWAKQERMIQLNVVTVAYLTRRLVGPMIERGRGGIVNISSGFGLSFLPGYATYVGTKHFVTGFTESLRCDLVPLGIKVTQVCPGPVRTEFEANVSKVTGGEPPFWLELSAEACARATISGLERGKALVVPGLMMKFVLSLNALAPRWVKRLIFGPFAVWLRKRGASASGVDGEAYRR